MGDHLVAPREHRGTSIGPIVEPGNALDLVPSSTGRSSAFDGMQA